MIQFFGLTLGQHDLGNKLSWNHLLIDDFMVIFLFFIIFYLFTTLEQFQLNLNLNLILKQFNESNLIIKIKFSKST